MMRQFQQERGFARAWLPQNEQFLLRQFIRLDNGGVRRKRLFRLIGQAQREADRILDSCWSFCQAQFQLNSSLQRLCEDLLVPRTQTPQHMDSVLLREGKRWYNLSLATTEPG